MHATFLYVLTPEYIAKVADRVKRFETSRQEFEKFLIKSWNRVPYAHEEFLQDIDRLPQAKSRAPFKEGGPYYLAHEIMNSQQCPTFCMGTYLRLLFLRRADLALREGADPSLAAFFKPKSFHKRDFDSEKALISVLKLARLPERCINDIILLNELAGNDPTPRPYQGRFPLWLVTAWSHYEGHLTGKEFASLSTNEPDGFFSLYRAACELNETNDEIVDEFLYVRRKTISAGPDALCIAIDGN